MYVFGRTRSLFPFRQCLIIKWRLPLTVERKKVSYFYDFFFSFSCPWFQVHCISFEWSPQPWLIIDPVSGSSDCSASSLVFFKESSSGVMPSLVRLHDHVWRADASRKCASIFRALRKPPWPFLSGSPLLACQAWVALRYSKHLFQFDQ